MKEIRRGAIDQNSTIVTVKRTEIEVMKGIMTEVMIENILHEIGMIGERIDLNTGRMNQGEVTIDLKEKTKTDMNLLTENYHLIHQNMIYRQQNDQKHHHILLQCQ